MNCIFEIPILQQCPMDIWLQSRHTDVLFYYTANIVNVFQSRYDEIS